MKNSTPKLWLLAVIAASTLALAACSDKGAATTQDDPTADAQTEVEQAETGVASANTSDAPMVNEGMAGDDVAVATDDGAMAGDDVAVASADDSEVLDGSETEEHVSTY